MGVVYIRDLPIECIIGVHPHERASRQRLLVSVELTTDFTGPARTDRLEDAIDYTAIARRIEAFAREGKFQLIETLAERLTDDLLKQPVTRVALRIEKPAALPATPFVGVSVEKDRRPAP